MVLLPVGGKCSQRFCFDFCLRGRPKTRSLDCISDLVWLHLGVESAELPEVAGNREVFLNLLLLLIP